MRIHLLDTHAQRLERWLGPEGAAHLSDLARPWYGPPIAVANVPGAVWAAGGGGFVGPIRGGRHASLADFVADRAKVHRHRMRKRLDAYFRANKTERFNAGFGSLDALIAGVTAGQYRVVPILKVNPNLSATGLSQSHWRMAGQPEAGAAAAAAPGGTAFTQASAGAIHFPNAASGTMHLTKLEVVNSGATQTLLLYDRLFGVAKTASSTATEAVTGVPTRYQSTTSGAVDSAEGNFLFMEVNPSAALGATAHNWTVCTYNDQAGAASTLPSVAGRSGAQVGTLDLPSNTWFAPLASGDTGIKALTQMQNSASVTGALDFVIGHPICFVPFPLANTAYILDGINSALSLVRIFDDAALGFLDLARGATTATTFSGLVSMAYN